MKGKIKIGAGVWLFSAFLIFGGYRYINIQSLIPFLIAVICHEAGHFFAALICGARLERLTIDIIGAKMSLCGKLLSYKEEFIIALFGPLVNLIIFALAYPLWKELSGFSLVLGILNLIPAPGFDGGRMLYSVTASRFGCGIADKTSRFFSFAAVLFIWLIGSYLLLRFSSGISVFILSFALLYGIAKKRE